MARAQGALFSIQAWGTLGDGIVYQRRRGGTAVFPKSVPRATETEGQMSQRNSFAAAVSSWKGLPEASKVRYVVQADGTRLSGYLLHIQNYLLGAS
ncbi:MAG: hypothetical protein KAV87_68525 [Desulfobacteraceae bacterium]|nr:hypothetical protein [Desulfobacteraceae bacterium]